MMKPRWVWTRNRVALCALIYEFAFSDPEKTEARIRRRLKSHQLGLYSQSRVDLLRRFKDEVQKEICKRERSRYFVREARQPKSRCSEFDDFHFEGLCRRFRTRFPRIARDDVDWFITFAIYNYYMR
jgi:hypothetical protein